MKEQSSTSTQKIQLPNKDLVGLKRSEEQKEVTKEKTKLPKPTGWRMLVLPFRMDEKTLNKCKDCKRSKFKNK